MEALLLSVLLTTFEAFANGRSELIHWVYWIISIMALTGEIKDI